MLSSDPSLFFCRKDAVIFVDRDFFWSEGQLDVAGDGGGSLGIHKPQPYHPVFHVEVDRDSHNESVGDAGLLQFHV